MRRLFLLVTLFSIVSAFAQVKSVEGSAGRLVTSRRPGVPVPAKTTDRLTNQDVVDMTAAGIADDIILETIRSAPAAEFDTSVAGLKALKAAKVSDELVRAMLNPHAPVPLTPPSDARNETASLAEIGVYLVGKGRTVQLEPEIVGWQTGGVLKRYATLGFDHGHINGKIMKPRSPLRLANPVELVVKTADGTSVTEYQLLRLYEKGNRREFRAMTGGVFHATGGAERTSIDFKPEKIAERTWRIRFQNLDRGEYGLLPPGISSASISSSGKMYTFSVTE